MFDDDITIDGHRDVLSMIHEYIYPFASRLATDAENAAIAANEPKAGTVNALPCPFCGEHDPITTTDETGAYQVYCTVCFSTGPSASTEYGAVTLWNQREV